MADIISVSLNDETLRELDSLQKSLGFSGRSETIRAAIRLLSADSKERTRLKGAITAVLIVIANEEHSAAITDISHDFQKLIKTQLHNHLETHNCFELFVLQGDASLVKSLFERFQTSKKIAFAKLIVA